eukprot:2073085-Prymnesium_polylepis.1
MPRRTIGAGGHLAIVECLELRELLGVGLEEVGELVEDASALAPRHPRPRPVVERLPRRGDRQVDVALAGLGDRANRLLGARVDVLEGLAVDGVDKLAVDDQFRRLRRRRSKCKRDPGGDAACLCVWRQRRRIVAHRLPFANTEGTACTTAGSAHGVRRTAGCAEKERARRAPARAESINSGWRCREMNA